MTLNADVVRVRAGDIEDALARLDRYRTLSIDEFLGNHDVTDAACYRLLVGIEAALGLCYHVSAKHLRKVPEEYAACFETLREGGVIDADLARRLQAMARFRNVLTHMYATVDLRRVHEIIRNDLGDLRQFATAVVRLLQPPEPVPE
jgi:uncharacterized protein YutE (UPF0331/DUF86 family)